MLRTITKERKNASIARNGEEMLRSFEKWLELHQGIDAAQVSISYDPDIRESRIDVSLATEAGRDRHDVQWMFGDHRAFPNLLIEVARDEFVKWYTAKGIKY